MAVTTENEDTKAEIDDAEAKVEEAEAELESPAEDAEEIVADAVVAEPKWPRRWLTVLLGVLLAAALAAAGWLGWLQWQTHQVNQAREQAETAAVAYAQVLTSIDSAHVDENFQQVLDGATGEFKDMYSQSSAQLRQLLIQHKATAHSTVLESAVQSATKDKVVVLLFVDQAVSNAELPDPRIDRSRIKMTMEHVDGKWRASKVELP